MFRGLSIGRVTGVYAGMTQGLHGVLLTLLTGFSYLNRYSKQHPSLLALVIAAFVENVMLLLSLITFLVLFLLGGADKKMLKRLWSTASLWTMTAGIIGGAIGTSFLTLGIQYAGEAYGVVLSVMFPIITAVISHWLFKEGITKIGIIGLVGVVLSAILLVVFDGSSSYQHFTLGIFLGGMAGLAWALEATLISFVFRKSENSLTDLESIMMRQVGSAPFSLLLLVPIFSSITASPSIGYEMFDTLFSSWTIALAAIACGINLFLSWLAYYNAIRHLGSTNATIINISYVIWAPILAMVIYPIFNYSSTIPNWSYWVFSITLIISIVVVLKNVNTPTDMETTVTKANKSK